MTVGEVLVIKPQQMEHGGPKVVDFAFVFGHVVTEFIGGSMNRTAFRASAGQPDGITVGVMVSSYASLRESRTSTLASPND